MALDIITEQKVYNPAGQHVGTVHKKNGQAYTGSWVVDGQWQHGQDLINKNSHVSSFSDLNTAKDHRYGANGYVSHVDNRKPYQPQQQQQQNYSGGGGGGGGGGASVGGGQSPFQPGGVNPGAYDPSDIIQTAIDRSESFLDNTSTPGTIDIDLEETNQSIDNDIEQNIGNKGDWTVNNNPVNSDQTYANIGNDFSLNLGSINNLNSNIKV